MRVVAPFRVDIPQADLDEVRDRLKRPRWPSEPFVNDDWQAGANLAYMRELVDYWLTAILTSVLRTFAVEQAVGVTQGHAETRAWLSALLAAPAAPLRRRTRSRHRGI